MQADQGPKETKKGSFQASKPSQSDLLQPQKVMKLLRNLIQRQMQEQSHLVSSECFNKMFSESEKYYMDEDDVIQLLQAFKIYLETYRLDQLNDIPIIDSNLQLVATKIFGTLHTVHFKNLNSLKVVQQFFTVTPFPEYINYNQLKFDSEDKEEYLKVAQAVKEVYDYADSAFLFLTNYLVSLARKMSSENQNIGTINQRLEEILEDLTQKHPLNEQILQEGKCAKIQSLKVEDSSGVLKSIDLRKFEPKQRNLQVEQFILDISKNASGYLKILVNVFKTGCQGNNAVSQKDEVKVEGTSSKSAIEKVKEKLFIKKFTKLEMQTQQTLDEFLEKEERSYQKQMAHTIEERDTEVQLTVSDMLRGKCTFGEISEIIRAAEEFIENCQKNNFRVVQIDNLVVEKTTNLIIKVDINGIISEFHLTFEFNAVKNEFSYKIRQLSDSEILSVTAMVFKSNEKFDDYVNKLKKVMQKLNAEGVQPRNNLSRKPMDTIKALHGQLKNVGKKSLQEGGLKSQRISELRGTIIEEVKKIQSENVSKTHQQERKAYRTGVFYDNLRQKKKAKTHFSKIVQDSPSQRDMNDNQAQKRIQLLKKLAKINKDKGDLAQALKCREECLEIQQRVKGKNSTDCAATLSNIGIIYKRNGDYASALKYYIQGLEIEEKVLGKGHIETASTFNNIGNVYKDKGDYDQALQYFQRCLELEEKHYGIGCFASASTFNNIGVTYRKKEDYDEALKYYTKCLEIEQRVKGKDSVECSSTLNNMGLVYRKKKQFDLALKYYEECLQIEQRVLGPEHIDCASSLNNIGVIYKSKGQFELALKYYEQCLAIQQHTFGKDHMDCSSTLNNIGMVHKTRGDFAQALKYFEQCLKIESRVYGEDHHETISTRKTVDQTRKKVQQSV